MKSTEISIGDFFEYTENIGNTIYTNFGKILRIYGETVDILDVDGKESKYIDIGSLKPIEITFEFLRLNNIEGEQDYVLYGFPLSIIGMTVPTNEYVGRIEYTHQLQHILRIFGIDDLKLI